MQPEQRPLTALQYCVLEELDLFVRDATRHFLYIVVPDKHTSGRTFAITEWLSRCTLQQCARITIFSGTGVQARAMLEATHAKMRERALIKIARSILELHDTPRMRFLYTYGGGQTLRGLGCGGKNTLHINMHTVLATLSDEQFMRVWLQLQVKQVWMVRASEFERLRTIYEEHRAGEIAQLGRDLQRLRIEYNEDDDAAPQQQQQQNL